MTLTSTLLSDRTFSFCFGFQFWFRLFLSLLTPDSFCTLMYHTQTHTVHTTPPCICVFGSGFSVVVSFWFYYENYYFEGVVDNRTFLFLVFFRGGWDSAIRQRDLFEMGGERNTQLVDQTSTEEPSCIASCQSSFGVQCEPPSQPYL